MVKIKNVPQNIMKAIKDRGSGRNVHGAPRMQFR